MHVFSLTSKQLQNQKKEFEKWPEKNSLCFGLPSSLDEVNHLLMKLTDHTTVIDAGKTRSRQKRYYMAVGTPTNVLSWTALQVFYGLEAEGSMWIAMGIKTTSP